MEQMDKRNLPAYQVPTVITFTDEEILEELGAAQTGSGVNPFGDDLGSAVDGPFPV